MALEQTDSGLFVPAQARAEVFPWDDLNAVNPPTGYTNIAHELIGALAVLCAQGTSRAKLLRSTDLGELYTMTRTVPVTIITGTVPGGSTVIPVIDSTSFRVGDVLTILSIVSGIQNCTGVVVGAIPDQRTLIVGATCGGLTYHAGDAVQGQVPVIVGNALSTDVFGPQVFTAPGAPLPGDSRIGNTNTIYGHRRLMVDDVRSYDFQQGIQETGNAAITITMPAQGAGFRNIMAYVIATTLSTAASGQDTLEIWQDAVGTGVLLHQERVSVVNANDTTRVILPGMRIKGNDNKQLIATMTTVSATIIHSLTVFGYIEG